MWNDAPEQLFATLCSPLESEWMWQGCGYSTAHFGELLQGQFSMTAGNTVRGLVTLPYRKAGVLSFVHIRPGRGNIAIANDKRKTFDAIKKYIEHHKFDFQLDISVQLKTSIPEGIGMGSSTADIVSTIRALDVAFGKHTLPPEVARLAVEAETASDSIMFTNNATLFAQRSGEVIETFRNPLPHMSVLGFNVTPGDMFSTIDNPPAIYTFDQIREFDLLREQLRLAIEEGDVASIGVIATKSTLLNEFFYPKPHIKNLIDIGHSIGSVGTCISHSGVLAGLIFPSVALPDPGKLSKIAKDIYHFGYEPIGFFHI